MLDINFIRDHREVVKQGMINKGEKTADAVDLVIEKDEEWRQLVTEIGSLRADSNSRAKEIGKLMGQGKKEEAQKIINETGQSKEKIKELDILKERNLVIREVKDA